MYVPCYAHTPTPRWVDQVDKTSKDPQLESGGPIKPWTESPTSGQDSAAFDPGETLERPSRLIVEVHLAVVTTTARGQRKGCAVA